MLTQSPFSRLPVYQEPQGASQKYSRVSQACLCDPVPADDMWSSLALPLDMSWHERGVMTLYPSWSANSWQGLNHSLHFHISLVPVLTGTISFPCHLGDPPRMDTVGPGFLTKVLSGMHTGAVGGAHCVSSLLYSGFCANESDSPGLQMKSKVVRIVTPLMQSEFSGQRNTCCSI